MTKPWFRAFVLRGDLRRADELLSEEHGWFETGLRARVASLALQQQKADRLFDAAVAAMALAPPETPEDILRLTLIGAFRIEDEILWDRAADATDSPPGEMPFQELADASGQLPLIGAAVQARVLLALGRDGEALTKYRELLERVSMLGPLESRIGPSDIAVWRCACACALANMGDPDAAGDELERAGLETCAAKYPIYQGLLAARLAALYERLDRSDDAEQWRAMLQRLDLPQHTKDAFDRRGKMMIERGAREESVLLL